MLFYTFKILHYMCVVLLFLKLITQLLCEGLPCPDARPRADRRPRPLGVPTPGLAHCLWPHPGLVQALPFSALRVSQRDLAKPQGPRGLSSQAQACGLPRDIG